VACADNKVANDAKAAQQSLVGVAEMTMTGKRQGEVAAFSTVWEPLSWFSGFSVTKIVGEAV